MEHAEILQEDRAGIVARLLIVGLSHSCIFVSLGIREPTYFQAIVHTGTCRGQHMAKDCLLMFKSCPVQSSSLIVNQGLSVEHSLARFGIS